jgi:hypothetical protein
MKRLTAVPPVRSRRALTAYTLVREETTLSAVAEFLQARGRPGESARRVHPSVRLVRAEVSGARACLSVRRAER